MKKIIKWLRFGIMLFTMACGLVVGVLLSDLVMQLHISTVIIMSLTLFFCFIYQLVYLAFFRNEVEELLSFDGDDLD